MSEVEKLYSLAGFEKTWTAIGDGDIEDCYPPFTAEKQLELSKWILSYWLESLKLKSYEEKLATFINRIWHKIPEFEQKRIRGILK